MASLKDLRNRGDSKLGKCSRFSFVTGYVYNTTSWDNRNKSNREISFQKTIQQPQLHKLLHTTWLRDIFQQIVGYCVQLSKNLKGQVMRTLCHMTAVKN